MVRVTGLPVGGLAPYMKKSVEAEAVSTAIEIQALAIASAPQVSGNYANRISVDASNKKKITVLAAAIYSYWLEYGVKKDGTKFVNQPAYATMRKAAREVAKRKGYKYV